MGRFAQFGLDDRKGGRNVGPPNRQLYCPFTDSNEHKRGFSLCFANFILSLEGARQMLSSEPEPARSAEDRCWQCAAELPGYHYLRSTWMCFCPSCAQVAYDHLTRPAPPPPAGYQFSLFGDEK